MSKLTFQSSARDSSQNQIEKYALFLGGLNVTRNALEQYDPLRTGFGRIFMIRSPKFLASIQDNEIKNKLRRFKHILEYANTGVSGNNNISMNFNSMQGGYTNRQMEIPNIATDDSNELTIKTYEFSGSPVREIIQLWMNGVADFQSGYAHYYGVNLDVMQSNHTAEFIYVVTDPSGKYVEYAALFANCFPKEVKLDHFNYDAGTHDLVQMDVSFTCTRYMSPAINQKATELIRKYGVLVNSLGFNPDLNGSNKPDMIEGGGTSYNRRNGKLESNGKNDILGYNASSAEAYKSPEDMTEVGGVNSGAYTKNSDTSIEHFLEQPTE